VVAFFWYVLSWNTQTNRGVDFFVNLYPLGICVLISAYQFIKGKERLFLIALAANLLAATLFFYVDKYNIMIDYDKWADRGMPLRFSQEPRINVEE
jgi:hypothetical protein